MKCVSKSKTIARVDNGLISQYNAEINYRKNVLKRIVAVVKFLASRRLGFRGDDEMLGSQNNGNYLGCLELISEFHPFLADHIQNYGNRGKGSTSYFSANICKEFINIIGKKMLTTIISEINAAKYYSISVDSTPDLSHVDQLTFIVRFVKDGKPIERFLLFLPIEEHKAQYMADTVLNFLENLKIPIKIVVGRITTTPQIWQESILVYRQELKSNVNLQFSSHVQHIR
ncbi:zinc finger MYM-type protein 1-like [Sipha flava]|uniref:Zinc finger MYM-type protein 1-like n=1 Tax=Sipha flava TaxID=143950 RepID=A0A8B8GD20_9HEMI|nr:zinc finger MYM-type protein 1-like [Sipha flava]